MSELDVRLYAIIDPENAGGHDLATLTRDVALGGVSLVQYRDKTGSTREMIDRARAVKEGLRGTGIQLIINDRVDIALAVDADGVHLGREDMDAATARRLLGESALVGETVHSLDEADSVAYGVTDYIGLGGVFVTTSKDNKSAPIGLAGLSAIAARVRHHAPKLKICAIAGIGAENAGDVIRSGADGVAVISSLSAKPKPGAAATELRRIVDDALESSRVK